MSTATPKPYQVVYDGPTQQLQYAVNPTGWTPINIVLPSYTTTARTALTPLQGTVVLDSTLNKLYFWGTDAAWHAITSA